jgi:hypothetical protein
MMEVRRCMQCAKPLPADYIGDRCSLCAIGLLPSADTNESFEAQGRHVVEGRQLSGAHCPFCHAELTLGDLGFRSCAICGAHFSAEKAEMLLRAVRLPATLSTRVNETTLGDKAWPDDAPLR